MRTILTALFMTLATQVAATDGEWFKCEVTSFVKWNLETTKYVEKGFEEDDPSDWDVLRVNLENKILSTVSGDDGFPVVYHLIDQSDFVGDKDILIFTDELDSEFPQLMTKLIIEDASCRKNERKLIEYYGSPESFTHLVATCEC